MIKFKNNQYWRSKLIKAGVKKSAWNYGRVYWPLWDFLKDKHDFKCHFDNNEFHNAILTLKN